MSIRTTTPVEDAAKLGGQEPGYYARAAKDRARMVSNGSVPVTTAMAVASWQGKYTGNEAVIAIGGDRIGCLISAATQTTLAAGSGVYIVKL